MSVAVMLDSEPVAETDWLMLKLRDSLIFVSCRSATTELRVASDRLLWWLAVALFDTVLVT